MNPTMFSLARNIMKAKNGFIHIKEKPHSQKNIEGEENHEANLRTLEQMARDEKNNKDLTEDQYFFNKLNAIFQKFLGPTIRRQYNYLQCENFIEENIMRSLDSIDQEELIDYGIKVLRKDVDKRLFEEIIILQKITENVESFKHIRQIKGREVLFTCVKNLKYKYGKMGTFIQKQDEPVRSLFIVIKGLIQVKTVLNKEEQTPKRTSIVGGFQVQQKKLERKDSTIRQIQNQQKWRQNQFKTGKLEKKYSFQDCLDELSTQGRMKCTYLNKGQSYGDKYILAQDDALAENQAYTFDNSHLAYLDIIKFKTILDERVLQKLQKEISEFSEMNVISQLEQKFVAALYVRTKLISFKRNNILTMENEKAEFIYFIKEGEVKLTKKLVYDNTHQEQAENQKKHTQQPLTSYQISHQNVQHYDLAILGKGQYIGLEEFFKEGKYQASSVIYSTEVTLHQISRYEFQQILSINRHIQDQITNFFEQQNDANHRQERVTIFNQCTGKIDTKSKQLEEEQEKLKSFKSEDEIKKNLLQGQDMIIKSSISFQMKPQSLNTNLEFIMQSISKESKFVSKRKKKQQNFMGCQFSEEQLENLKRSAFVPIKQLQSRMQTSTNEQQSPLKQPPKLGREFMSTTNLKQNNTPLYNPSNKKSLRAIDVKSADFDFFREKQLSSFTHLDQEQDYTDPIKSLKHINPLTERLSHAVSISSSRLQNNRYNKLRLDPIVVNQSTQVTQFIDEKMNSADLENSVQAIDLRSPIGISQSQEIHSEGLVKNKLNLKLKFPIFKERHSIDAPTRDSSRYKQYFNESLTQITSQNHQSIDPLKIKSFSQLNSITLPSSNNQNNHNNDLNSNYNTNNNVTSSNNNNNNNHNNNNNYQQQQQITNYEFSQNLNQSTFTKGNHSRKNSNEVLEIKATSPTKSGKQKFNFNRIHARLEPTTFNDYREGFQSQRSQSTKNQFLPLKYSINDIIEQKDFQKTMYKDNQKRAKLQQQARSYYKFPQNPYLDIQTYQ